MGQTKSHSPLRYGPALLALLLAAALILGTGISYGRYRAEIKGDWALTPKASDQVYLCQISSETYDITTSPATWQVNGDNYEMKCYLTNGSDWDEYAQYDQRATVRLLAGPGVLNGDDGAAVDLVAHVVGAEEEAAYRAEAIPISYQSALYKTFGPGWVFRFLDADGQEISWELEGGRLNMVSLRFTVSSLELQEETLLQLQVTGDMSVK